MQFTSLTKDGNLRSAVLDAFAADPHTACLDLRIGVLNGIVHLAGKVDTLQKRTAVEEVARRVEGVRGVANRIEALGGPDPARTIDLKLIDK